MKKIFTMILFGAVFTALCAFPQTARAQRDYLQPVEISPAKLVSDYKANFHEADAMYTGRLLILTGRVETIQPPERTYRRYADKIYAYITIDAGPGNQPVVIYFWDWEASRALLFREGSTVSVMGFCQGVVPQLSLIESCVYPAGCGGPVKDFEGPYFKLPPSPQRRNRPAP